MVGKGAGGERRNGTETSRAKAKSRGGRDFGLLAICLKTAPSLSQNRPCASRDAAPL
jgi:hypothetical protein